MDSIMQRKPLEIVVIGGSLSGLFTGIALKRLGHNVTILERNDITPSMTHRGAGIVLGSEVQAFLRAYAGGLDHITVNSRFRIHLDETGTVIDTSRCEQVMGSWDIIYHVLRTEFDGLESVFSHRPTLKNTNSQGKASYKFDHKVTGIKDAGARVEVHTTTNSGENPRVHCADLVIGADGPSSYVRKALDREKKRAYGGYVAWRGVVNEGDLSHSARRVFSDNLAFFHGPQTQILAYSIPGSEGQLEPGHRLINWVWYCNSAECTTEHRELMTDRHGTLHSFNLPRDGMRPDIWIPQLEKAEENLPPQFAELVGLTAEPFIQSITDVVSSRMSLLDGKVLLVGDAAATFRPHTAASTNQGASHALMLADVFKGEMTLAEWEKKSLQYARNYSALGMTLGNKNELGDHGCVPGHCPENCLLASAPGGSILMDSGRTVSALL